MSSLNLKLTSFEAIPAHMAQFDKIAKAQGLTKSALLRLMVARTVRRKSGKRKSS
jgi:hypothetical protein